MPFSRSSTRSSARGDEGSPWLGEIDAPSAGNCSGARPVAASDLDRLLLAVGRIESRTVRSGTHRTLRDSEFRVFSQFGEDGIIQYLISRVPIEHDTFVEFGVGDYRESNTRFLLCNDNWRGLILDSGTSHVDFIRTNPIGWRHTIDALSVFVTRENINEAIAGAGITGDIGLLSVDIDGNDYWVLDAIDVVSPRILIVEYNSTFGPDAAVSVPYDPKFDRMNADSSNLYWGASLAAMCLAAHRKGLAFVGSNSAGNNAFFVREDILGDVPALTSNEGWVDARFRDSREFRWKHVVFEPAIRTHRSDRIPTSHQGRKRARRDRPGVCRDDGLGVVPGVSETGVQAVIRLASQP